MKILLFVWGACWSSFITTYGWRYLIQNHPGYRPASSICDYCHHKIHAVLLIPIVGFAVQRGKCKYCKVRINPLWTMFEIINGIIWIKMPLMCLTDYLGFGVINGCLLLLCVQDWFDQRVHCLLFCGLLPLYWLQITPYLNVFTFMWAAIFCLGYFSQSIGNGDIDFMIIITILCGPVISIRAIGIGCVLGLLYAALSSQRKLPFIPFLSLGLMVGLIWQSMSPLPF